MIVKVYRVDGICELFTTNEYKVTKAKDLHPLIMKLVVFTDSGKKIFSKCRKNRFIYKHFTFKTAEVQDKLRQEIQSDE